MRKLAALFLVANPIALLAWGTQGHTLVVRIAEAQLTPAVRERVAAILGPGRHFITIGSWADDVRRARPQTANWHFINIPVTAPRLDKARDCPSGDCVVAAITRFRKTLRDAATPPEKRAEALMFLAHFIGDMHQPLHCGDKNDRGGNDIQVKLAGRPSNLHSVWDSGLLARMGSDALLFDSISRESARRAKKFRKGTVEQWAEEGHQLARKSVYGKLPKAAPGSAAVINAAYEKMADVIIREQLAKAGARLAWVLNEALR